MQHINLIFGLALLSVAWSSNGLAADAGGVVAKTPSTVLTPAAPIPIRAGATTRAGHLDGFGPSVALSTLANLSGGTSVSEQITLNGSVSQNTDENVATGSNVISGSAFSGAAGLPTVIQNTGNNVLIQNATIVNVQFKP